MYVLYFLTAIGGASLLGRGLVGYATAANVVANVVYVAVTLRFYEMFKPVNSRVSLIAAICSIIGSVIQAFALFHINPIHVSPFVFFGLHCILLGYLIFKSTFLPMALGLLMAVADLGWLASLSPLLARGSLSYIMVLGVLAEGSFMLWLLVVGVNASKYNEKTNQTR